MLIRTTRSHSSCCGSVLLLGSLLLCRTIVVSPQQTDPLPSSTSLSTQATTTTSTSTTSTTPTATATTTTIETTVTKKKTVDVQATTRVPVTSNTSTSSQSSTASTTSKVDESTRSVLSTSEATTSDGKNTTTTVSSTKNIATGSTTPSTQLTEDETTKTTTSPTSGQTTTTASSLLPSTTTSSTRVEDREDPPQSDDNDDATSVSGSISSTTTSASSAPSSSGGNSSRVTLPSDTTPEHDHTACDGKYNDVTGETGCGISCADKPANVLSGMCSSRHHDPNNPCVLCSQLPEAFIVCNNPDCAVGKSYRYEDVKLVNVTCRPTEGIPCFVPGLGCATTNATLREFVKQGVPCLKYSGNSFLTVLLCSMFLGFLGVDRFMLGHIGAAIVKLLTLGGLGFWWLLDVVMLTSGILRPIDGLWEPLY